MFVSINSGSSSLKVKIFDNDTLNEISVIQLKNYSGKEVVLELSSKKNSSSTKLDQETWEHRFDIIANEINKNSISVDGFSEENIFVYRIVHGGEKYTNPLELRDNIIEDLEENYNLLAPLHNPIAIKSVKEFRKIFPEAKHFGVFDTAFGKDIPAINFLYGLPFEMYEEHRVRRYSFHGISHKYVYTELLKINSNLKNVISLHLGSGSSVVSIVDGKCYDTSFGFTPNENLIMSTRSGEIDYDAIHYLKNKLKLSDKELDEMINKKSGMFGISGYTQDMKILLDDYHTNTRAKLAVDMFVDRIVKSIYAQYAHFEKLDAIIFTGGIGQGSDVIRKMICSQLRKSGVYLDDTINIGKIDVSAQLKINSENSEVQIYIIPTNEELQMVQEIKSLDVL